MDEGLIKGMKIEQALLILKSLHITLLDTHDNLYAEAVHAAIKYIEEKLQK